jgi:hypothetical protein
MAQRRIITEGFDLYPSDMFAAGIGFYSTWDPAGNTSYFGNQIVDGRFAGSKAIQCGATSTFFRPLPANTLQVVCGFAYHRNIPQIGIHPVISLWSSVRNRQFTLSCDSIGRLMISNATTLLATSDDRCIVNNAWHYIEMEFFLHNSVGICNIYLDGVAVSGLQFTGPTKTISDIDIGQFCIESGSLAMLWYDDLYVEVDGLTRVGEGRIEALRPTSTTTNSGFTPSTGSTIWGVLDEAQIDVSDYASATAAGSFFRLGMSDLAYAPEKIYGVQVESVSQKNEAGTRIVRNKIFDTSATVNGVSRAQTLNTFQWNRDWLDVTPNTGVPFTLSSIATLDVGVEIVT